MYIGYNQDRDDRVAEKAVKRKVKIAQIQSAALSTQIWNRLSTSGFNPLSLSFPPSGSFKFSNRR